MSTVIKTYTDKNGVKTDYAVFGNGKKIFVIIPGLSIKPVTQSADEIAQAYDIFSKDYTVYVFDRPRPLNDGASVCDFAENIFEVLKELKIENAYFFGASQGGMILQCLMLSHPQIIKKAVLGSTAARADSNMKNKIDRWISLAESGDSEKLHLKFFSDIYSEELINSLGDNIYSLIPECTAEELDDFVLLANMCKKFCVYENLCKVKCPILVIGSEKDKIMSRVRQTELAEDLGAELYLYPSFGHAVYDEAPDYKQRLIEFFER